jgi:hypothetical protein
MRNVNESSLWLVRKTNEIGFLVIQKLPLFLFLFFPFQILLPPCIKHVPKISQSVIIKSHSVGSRREMTLQDKVDLISSNWIPILKDKIHQSTTMCRGRLSWNNFCPRKVVRQTHMVRKCVWLVASWLSKQWADDLIPMSTNSPHATTCKY